MRSKTLIKILYLSAALVFCLGILIGCSVRQNQPTQQNQEDNGRLKVGFSMDTLREEHWKKDKDSLVQRAQELGIDLIVLSANSDDLRQIAQAKSLVDAGVDVLMVAPHNAELAAEIVEYAHSKGVPVLSYDRLIRNAEVDAHVSVNQEKIGQLQTEYITKIAPTGNYVYIGGAPTDNTAILLRKGALDALKPFIDSGAIKLVYDELTPEWSPIIAQQNMTEALEGNNNDIAAVITANDSLAGGVIAALGPKQLAGKIPVAGNNADLPGLHRILEGTQIITVYKPVKDIATAALNVATALAKKETFETNATLYNGKIEVPSILLEPTVVDKNNIMDTVIKEGYQTYEQVYENVPEDQRPKR